MMREGSYRYVCRVTPIDGPGMGFPLGISFRVPSSIDPCEFFVSWYEEYAPNEVPVEFHSSTRRDTVFYKGTHKDWDGHHVCVLTTDDFQMTFIQSEVYSA